MSILNRAPIFWKAMRDLRWHIVGYGVGLGLLAAMYVLLYPAFSDQLAGFEMPENYSAFIGDVSDITSPRGFFQIEFFSFWLPLLLAVYAIVGSTGQLAGDEGNGTLELMLAQPISRRRLFLQRTMALALGAVLILALTGAGFVLSAPLIDIGDDLTRWELATAGFGMLPFAFAMIALGLLVGTVTSSRAQAASLMTAGTVVLYVLDILAALVESLQPLKYGSTFYYSDAKQLLLQGAEPSHAVVLLVAAAVLGGLALISFQGREIGTGRASLFAWPGRRRPTGPEAQPAP